MEQKILGFGCMRLPCLDANDPASFNYPLIEKLFDTFLEHGFDYFDTAYVYHGAKGEEAVRRALVERHPRESFKLATKLPLRTFKDLAELERTFDKQLKNCGVDYFDYYLLHNIGSNVWARAKKHGAFELVARKKAEGKIKFAGFSFHDKPQLLEQILSEYHSMFDFIQLQVNYADMETEGIQCRECLEIAQKYKLPVTVMEPLKGGTLANPPEDVRRLLELNFPGQTPASVALRFAATQHGVVRVLSGMNSLEQLEENMNTFENLTPLTDEEISVLAKAAEILNSEIKIACTACNYCVSGCPKGILIPKIFALYNSFTRNTGSFSSENTYYTNLVVNSAFASDCIKCGKCEQACPQHLPIRKLLEDCVQTLEVGNVILAPILEKKKAGEKFD